MIFDHAVHPFRKNRVLRLEELMARISPPLDRFFDKFPLDDEWIVVGKLPRLRSTFFLSSWTTQLDKPHLLVCQVHNVIYMDRVIIRTQQRFLGGEEGGRLVVPLLPCFVWAEVRGSVSYSVFELDVKRPDGLVDTPWIRRTLDVGGQRPRELRDQLEDFGDWVLWRWFREFPKASFRFFEATL